MDFDILMLVLNTKHKIAIEGEIELLNSIITDEPLYLTGTKIDEERDQSPTSNIRQLMSFVNEYKISSNLL